MTNNLNNLLEYRGYIGSIEVDMQSDILFGHVQNLKNKDDVVSYEGETIKQLREDFENAVDDYMHTLGELVRDN